MLARGLLLRALRPPRRRRRGAEDALPLGSVSFALRARSPRLRFRSPRPSARPAWADGFVGSPPRRRQELPPPPCGYPTAWFSALLGISAAVVLVPVGIWFAINRRMRKPQ